MLKNLINKVFKKARKKDWFKTHPEIRIVPAFTLAADGEYPETTYYEFEDPNNLTLGRGFAASDYYRELSMCVTREFLKAHTIAVNKILKNPRNIDIFEIAKLTAQLEERNNLIVDSITPYKLGSVIYFDETEDPYSFDYVYSFKKIERWKKQPVNSFFLQTPLKNLIPSNLWSEENLENYLKIVTLMDKEHYKSILDVLSLVLSEEDLKSDWLNKLKSEKNII